MKLKPLAFALGLASAAPAFAGHDDYVHVPTVEQGEKEIDLRYGVAKNGEHEHEHAATIGFGYGATSWWFTELYLKFEKEPRENFTVEAYEWENRFQLTETGKYPVDIGLLTEIEVLRKRQEGYEFRFGPMFQTEFGKVQLNANLLLERQFRDKRVDENGEREHHDLEFGYQWQAKYRLMPAFEFGAQGFGETGKWNHWAPSAEQNHRAGPAVFGKIPVGDHQAIKYNAAFLFGISEGAPNHTLRAQLEYEF